MGLAKASIVQPATSAAAADEARNGSRPSLPVDFTRWNDRHKGEDVYVLGASPQLAFLTDSQVAHLSRQVVLGGNNTFYKVPITYFVSAYPLEIYKAAMHLPHERLLHMKRLSDEPLDPQISSVNRQVYSSDVGLNRYFTQPAPVLYTARNQALAMLHLAVIMGARRVIYIGVDQTNYAYFWQYDDRLREALRRDTHKLLARRAATPDAGIYFDHVYKLLEEPVDVREKMPFYEDLTPVFAEYVQQARRHGTEVVATLENSVVHKAGAAYLPLDECLGAGSSPPVAAPGAAAPARPATRPGKPRKRASVEGPVPPILVAGLPAARRTLADQMKSAGIRMGRPHLWSDRAAAAVLEWTRSDGSFRQREPLMDHPEPLVEAAGRKGKIFLRAVQQIATTFASDGLMFDLMTPEELDQAPATPWSMRAPWGWDSSFDLSLMAELEHVFSGIRLAYVQPSDRRALAGRLVDEFAAKAALAGGVEVGRNASEISVRGAPVRQMHVLNATDAGLKGPAARFSLRCAEPLGALGLIDTHDQLACAAARRLGPDRVVFLPEELVTEHPARALEQVSALLGE